MPKGSSKQPLVAMTAEQVKDGVSWLTVTRLDKEEKQIGRKGYNCVVGGLTQELDGFECACLNTKRPGVYLASVRSRPGRPVKSLSRMPVEPNGRL